MSDKNLALELHGIMTAVHEQKAAEAERADAHREAAAAESVDAKYWPLLIESCKDAAQRGLSECTITITKDRTIPCSTERWLLARDIAVKLGAKARQHGFSAHVPMEGGMGEVFVDWVHAPEKAARRQAPATDQPPENRELNSWNSMHMSQAEHAYCNRHNAHIGPVPQFSVSDYKPTTPNGPRLDPSWWTR
jgi:hypothetical protein